MLINNVHKKGYIYILCRICINKAVSQSERSNEKCQQNGKLQEELTYQFLPIYHGIHTILKDHNTLQTFYHVKQLAPLSNW